MKIIKDTNPKNKTVVPPNSRIEIKTDPNLFTLPCMAVFLGKRGVGKSVSVCNLLRRYKETDTADRIIVISPTVNSNKALLDELGVKPEDIIDPESKTAVKELRTMVENERDDYEQYLDKKEKWTELQKMLKNHSLPIHKIPDEMLIDFVQDDGMIAPPLNKYGKDRPPILHCWVDDCQNSNLFRGRAFANFCIKHRHEGGLKRGGAIGCSLYVCIQNLKSQAGGCPKTTRNNCTVFCLCGKTKDESELKDIYSSIAGEVEYDTEFKPALDYALAEPYNSLYIDFHPKEHHPSRFRKNLNEFIITENKKLT